MAERPNPQSIAICSLIALYSDPNSLLHALEFDGGSSIAEAENKVAAFLEDSVFGNIGTSKSNSNININISNSNSNSNNYHDRYRAIPANSNGAVVGSDALEQWMVRLKGCLGAQAAELLMETLKMASESVDALVDLFELLKGSMHEGLVDATSLHGLYLRQHCLGFSELSFESSVLLWQALKERVWTIQQNGCLEAVLDPDLDLDLDINVNVNVNGSMGFNGATTTTTATATHNSSENYNYTSWVWPLSTEQLQSILREDCIGFETEQGRGDYGGGDGDNLLQNTNSNNNSNSNDTNNDGMDTTNTTTTTTTAPNRSHRTRCSFEQMEVYIRKMLKIDPELPAAHFLRYLNCLRHGERVGALDALHEYFDHSMVQHKSGRSRSTRGNANASDTASGAAASGIGIAAGTSRDILQFSAILLAMTHSSFGDSNLALLATEEAVRVAQQSKDASCVAFALGWLYEHHGQGTAERTELLRRCARRASQGQLRPLVAGARLTLAKHALRGEGGGNGNGNGNGNGTIGGLGLGLAQSATVSSSSVHTAGGMGTNGQGHGFSHEGAAAAAAASRTATSWNHLLQVTAEPSTDHGGALDRPTYLSQNPREVLESMALQRLVSAGIWDSLGMPAVSKWASRAALSQHRELSYADLLAAIQNISRCALYGPPPKKQHETNTNTNANTNANTNTNTNTALFERQHRPSCCYARAASAMLQLRTELGLDGNDMEEPILQHLALIFHEWAVHRGDTDDAMALQTMLDSYLHPGLYNRDQLYADIRMQKYVFYCRTKNWEKAKQIGTSLVQYCKRKGFLNNEARILIQMGISELETDRKQCTTALSPLLEALAVCEKWEMHGLHAAAMSILARVFLRLQNPKRAIAIIEGTMPTLLQREHIWFQAEAYLSLAKAHLKLTTNSAAVAETPSGTSTTGGANNTGGVPNPGAVERHFRRALRGLNKSMHLFEDCQDRHRLREVYYLQARIHSLLRNTAKRDAMSEKFIKLGNAKRRSNTVTAGVSTDNTTNCRASNGSLLDALGNPLAIQVLVGRSIL